MTAPVRAWVSDPGVGWAGAGGEPVLSLPAPTVPELAARGIIQQVFPVHEQRILNRLMKSWVQAVCENQPLGVTWVGPGLGVAWVGVARVSQRLHGWCLSDRSLQVVWSQR